MLLFTKQQHEKLLKNGSQQQSGKDHKPVVKWFTPDGNMTWLVTEIVENGLAFGLCDLGVGYPELGYIDIEEIQSLRGSIGCCVERDFHFQACHPISVYKMAANFYITESEAELEKAKAKLYKRNKS